MKISRMMKWITAACETFLAIPFVGGVFILSTLWTALGVMFVLHVITLILSIRDKESSYGSIMGIAASLFGVIPFLGMVLHMMTAILLFISAFSKR